MKIVDDEGRNVEVIQWKEVERMLQWDKIRVNDKKTQVWIPFDTNGKDKLSNIIVAAAIGIGVDLNRVSVGNLELHVYTNDPVDARIYVNIGNDSDDWGFVDFDDDNEEYDLMMEYIWPYVEDDEEDAEESKYTVLSFDEIKEMILKTRATNGRILVSHGKEISYEEDVYFDGVGCADNEITFVCGDHHVGRIRRKGIEDKNTVTIGTNDSYHWSVFIIVDCKTVYHFIGITYEEYMGIE